MTLKAKRRAIYPYSCANCGKRRLSLVYLRASGKVCSKCRREKVPENQPSLFTT
jgi:predicted SprT family Zn-dependent metalloprotease